MLVELLDPHHGDIENLPDRPTDSEMLDFLIPRVVGTEFGATIKNRAHLRKLMKMVGDWHAD